MIFARVVLPEPDSPTIAKQSFFSIIKLMSCNALTIVFLIKNFFEILLILIIAIS